MEFWNRHSSGNAPSKVENCIKCLRSLKTMMLPGASSALVYTCVFTHTHANICIHTLACGSLMTWLRISSEANPPHLENEVYPSSK